MCWHGVGVMQRGEEQLECLATALPWCDASRHAGIPCNKVLCFMSEDQVVVLQELSQDASPPLWRSIS